jgi:hypothetical protein
MSYPYANELNDNTKENTNDNKKTPAFASLYMITHIIISFFAIYLSWRCNNGFNLMSFGIALFCPYLYIILALATRGGCGIFDANCLVEPIRRLNP